MIALIIISGPSLPLGYYWATTGLLLGYHWATTGVLLGYYWATTGLRLGYHWATTGLPLGVLVALHRTMRITPNPRGSFAANDVGQGYERG